MPVEFLSDEQVAAFGRFDVHLFTVPRRSVHRPGVRAPAGYRCCRQQAHPGLMAWWCGKCDGMEVPEHHRFCPKRDPKNRVKRVIVVVWPPFGRRHRQRDDDAPGSQN